MVSENGVVEKFEEDSVKEEQAESDTVEEAVTEEEESNAEARDTKADDSQTTSRKIEVPNDKVGVLTSKGGDTIKHLQYLSGAKIQITRDMDAEPHSTTRPVELIGTLSSIKMAEKLITVVIEADSGGSPSLVARGQTIEVGDQIEMEIPNDRVTLLLGRGGDTINAFEADSGAHIELSYEDFLDGSIKWTVRLTGNREQIEMARAMVQDIATRDWMDPRVTGGYQQQSFQSMTGWGTGQPQQGG